MISPEAILNQVETAVRTIMNTGDNYGGLFPGILNRETGEMPPELPKGLPGGSGNPLQKQRNRAYPGCNPIYDEPLLQTMYGLSEATGEECYAEGADQYLERYATHCTDTVTGLFPWGEHAFWHLEEDRVGDGYNIDYPGHDRPIFDHNRAVPPWLWEKIHGFNQESVHRFADGLKYHWFDTETPRMNRHAPITDTDRIDPGASEDNPTITGQPSVDKNSLEVAEDPTGGSRFPTYGGYFILDWAFAYTKRQEMAYPNRIREMLDHWWETRDSRGLLPKWKSGERRDTMMPQYTISVAASYYEAADLIDEVAPDLASVIRRQAETYVDGFLSAPHDLENGVFITQCRTIDAPILAPPRFSRIGTAEVYGANGGVASLGLTSMCAWHHGGNDKLRSFAEAVARWYDREPVPRPDGYHSEKSWKNQASGTPMNYTKAGNIGHALDLFVDLYESTGEERWRRSSLDLADTAVELFFDDGILPRGAVGLNFYDNELGTSYLLHGLARVALAAGEFDTNSLDPNYTSR